MNPLIKEQYKYSEITAVIIGSAMEVHNILGPGFQEVIYQRSLAIEMDIRKLSFSREHEMLVFFKNHQVGERRVDFLVEKFISVEIKAVSALDDANLNQAINYLEVYNLEIGMLINFGAKSLEYKRLINSKFKAV